MSRSYYVVQYKIDKRSINFIFRNKAVRRPDVLIIRPNCLWRLQRRFVGCQFKIFQVAIIEFENGRPITKVNN